MMERKVYSIITVLLFVIVPLYGNEDPITEMFHLVNKYSESADYVKAMELLDEAMALQLTIDEKNDTTIGMIHFMKGRCWQLSGNWESSIKHLKIAAQYYEKGFGRNHRKTADAIYSIGKQIGLATQNYDSTLYYFKIALAIYERIDSPVDQGWTYRAMSEVYQKQGLHQKALNSSNKAVEILSVLEKERPSYFQKYKKDILQQLSHSYFNLASLYAIINDRERSFYYAEQAKLIIENNQELHSTMKLQLYLRTAELYQVSGDLGKSLQTYENLMESAKHVDAPVEKRGIYIKMGKIAYAMKTFNEANDYFKDALILSNRINAKDSTHFAEIWLEQGKVALAKGNLQQAILQLNKALQIYNSSANTKKQIEANRQLSWVYLKLGETDQAIQFNEVAQMLFPRISDNPQALSSPDFAQLLADQAYFKMKLFEAKDNIQILAQSKNLFEQSLEMLNTFEQEIFHQNTYFTAYNQIYEWYFQLLYKYHQETGDPDLLNSAFQLCESSKANALLASGSWRSLPDLPEQFILKEEQLQADLTAYRKKIFDTPKNEILPDQIELWSQEVVKILQDLADLKERIKKEQPEYYAAKYAKPIINISEAQNLLPNAQTAALEFFYGDSSLFVFTILKNQVFLDQIPFQGELKQAIIDFRQMVSRHPSKSGGFEKSIQWIHALGSTLSNILLSQSFNHINTAVDQLLIIPDGLLSYLPFELIRIDNQQKYLIESYTTAYAYSMSFLKDQLAKENTPTEHFLGGFAPSYNEYTSTEADTLGQSYFASLVREGFYPLPGALDEVQQIASLFKAQAIINEEATVDRFLSSAPNFQVLHLAMHAFVEDQKPEFSKLIFSSDQERNKLTALELYNLKLNAQMVVLSACNSGFGQFKKGEAVLSLSHAFSYAGIPSTVMSLWQVPDGHTTDLMLDFYKSLKEGQRKDQALRQSKLSHLKKYQGLPGAHPYFWAGFIASGNMSPIVSGNNLLWKVFIGILALSLFLLGRYFYLST